MRIRSALLAASLPITLAACATMGSPSPVDVTRFVEPSATARLGTGTAFVEAAPGSPEDGLAMSPYISAVASQLNRIGYREMARGTADQVVQVRIQRSQIDAQGRRGPVSVGVGGSTGSYGSGLGLGLGINLGGGGGPRIATQLGVMIRDRATNEVLWEGRADFDAPAASRYATPAGSAQVLADAVFQNFPGNNGETVRVEVPE
ncbi:DUF4136 domain-containing protein [Erythrobacter sp. LQ02-29]|uniref:DUF4136 domain-containing protein n=1 Tax=Erythrobacter sp. LQ02-29 TaxID=2920384 RepID=UPI001F4E5FD2|nr:DUF4136 domain-containing protein [Erythrobacter sp. LQ02-29]MCP9222111.1 DUF4136 domain-containing protein [Erythrobacter sp. LQ02-29]